MLAWAVGIRTADGGDEMDDRLNRERAMEILRRFRGRRFLVVGDLMLDRYVFGDVSRISGR